ncbi:MAG TPA: hypothetical protein VMM78_06485 [Thermomicrobiales bacterium]|nr:hypothetical protein [Thermomicrobiales bacterium]
MQRRDCAVAPVTARRAGWISGSIVATCAIVYAIIVTLLNVTSHDVAYPDIALLGFPIVGAVIVSRQPRNTIGWLLVIAGALIALASLAAASVDATLGPEPIYWQRLVGWAANAMFGASFNGLLIALVFLFPTGRPLSARWGMAGGVVGLFFVGISVVLAVRSGPLMGYFSDAPQLTNPFGIAALDPLMPQLELAAAPVGAFAFLTSLLAIIARVRHSRGVERLQLQWFGLAVVIVAVSYVASVLSGEFMANRWSWVVGLLEAILFLSAAVGIPVAIGVAILRYRLYSIDLIIQRALVYGVLTSGLGAAYWGGVVLLQQLLRPLTSGSGLAVAGSTLAVAALFQPLRVRIQRLVDRRFFRRKYDAMTTVEAFSAQLRDAVDLDTLRADLCHVIEDTVQPSHVSIWLRPTPGAR